MRTPIKESEIIKKSSENTGLDEEIGHLFKEMKEINTDSEDYALMVDQLVKLYSLKAQMAKKRVSPDTMAIVAGNLVGILVIVWHERANVVTSKAVNFVMKLR